MFMLQDADIVIEDEEIVELAGKGDDEHVQALKVRKEELQRKMEEKKKIQENREVSQQAVSSPVKYVAKSSSRHSLSRHPRNLTKMSRYPNVDINVDSGMLTNSVCV